MRTAIEPPLEGEAWSRAAERCVERYLAARGWKTDLREPGSHGGDVFAWDVENRFKIVEVRSSACDQNPVFDIEKGLARQRRLADTMRARGEVVSGIVMVYVWVDTETRTAEMRALGGEHFEAVARRNATEYQSRPGPRIRFRRRPLYPMGAEDMVPIDEILGSADVGGQEAA